MDYDSQNAYLETEVLTATPQKLQLMMISGAIRFAHQARQLGESGQSEPAWEALLRCRAVVTQILCGIKTNGQPLLRQVAGIYLYVFRELTTIQQAGEYHRLAEIIPVLEEERQTWQQLCEIMPEAPERPAEEVREITARDIESAEQPEDSPSQQAPSQQAPSQQAPSASPFSQPAYSSGSFDSSASTMGGSHSSGGGGFSLDA